ncbi:MAG: GerMN domain-containing protein [Oscillospiraceae bacterium]|nr:GerMN domain-containing protein [Oscillospiraceae bacterium]
MNRLFPVLMVVVLCLTGCYADAPDAGNTLTVYVLGGPDDRAALAEHTLPLPEERPLWRAALDGVLSGSGGRSPFPAGTRVIEAALPDGVLDVVLSEEADALGGYALTLARACLVLTLTALDEGIGGVRISVEGRPADSTVYLASDFVLEALVLADMERPITLFFPDETGRVLSESRTLVVRETDTVEWYLRYMLEEMLAGPRTESLLPVFPEGTRLLSIIMEGGICAVNVSSEFVSNAGANPVSPGMVLHCLVRAAAAQPGVSAVRLLVEGRQLEAYGEIDTSQPLTAADVRP